jgi:hypothetical protein
MVAARARGPCTGALTYLIAFDLTVGAEVTWPPGQHGDMDLDVLGEPVEERQDRAGATLPSCSWIATALFGWWQGRTSRCAAR